MKKIGLVFIVLLTGCATLNNGSYNQIQILDGNSTLINGCKKLGPIHVDIQAINFNKSANDELLRQAYSFNGTDSIAIVDRKNLPLGHVIINATALKCYE